MNTQTTNTKTTSTGKSWSCALTLAGQMWASCGETYRSAAALVMAGYAPLTREGMTEAVMMVEDAIELANLATDGVRLDVEDVGIEIANGFRAAHASSPFMSQLRA